MSFTTEYGGWANLPYYKFNEDMVMYSFGAGEDISYEYYLSGKKDLNIYIFDPTPRAIEHYNYCNKIYIGEIEPIYNNKLGGGDIRYNDIILESNANIDKINYIPCGLYSENKMIEFYLPKKKEWVSLSINNLQNTNETIELEVKTIDKLMEKMLHKNIDILKLNIEGAEVASLDYMIEKTKIRPKWICVKFELRRDLESGNKPTNELIDKLLIEYNIIYKHMDNYTFELK
jgi:FkbM family methyltransferase